MRRQDRQAFQLERSALQLHETWPLIEPVVRSVPWNRATAGEDYSHLATHQIGRQRGQSIVLPIRPTIFDRDVVALDIADLAQTAKESGDIRRIRPRGRRP